MPTNPAIIIADSGKEISHVELENRISRIITLLRDEGCQQGDSIALMLPNVEEYLEIILAGLSSGLNVIPLNTYLPQRDIDHIISVSSPKIVFTVENLNEYSERARNLSPSAFRSKGRISSFSSGTTGLPKCILINHVPSSSKAMAHAYQLNGSTIFMGAPPLFSPAVLHYALNVIENGGTIVVPIGSFNPLKSLEYIEKYSVTNTVWVPSMFVRLLRLSQKVRENFNAPHHRNAMHTGAPCPITIKEQMIDWWGPIIVEGYGSSEMYGFTSINSHDWLNHKGSIGKPIGGEVFVCDEKGNELPPRTIGKIYFGGLSATSFTYANNPEKTSAARHPKFPWTTVGDIGYVDEEGFIYLTDRQDNMIISGGFNIYPQPIEQALREHPLVDDAAVFGVPNEVRGEEVKALVQLSCNPSDEIRLELLSFLKERVSKISIPRSIEFVDSLPRLPNGKLYKRFLTDQPGNQATPLGAKV